MQVFITYEKDEYGGEQVYKIFAKMEDAISYVIKHIFGSNGFYANQTQAEKRKLAIEFIDIYEVEGI